MPPKRVRASRAASSNGRVAPAPRKRTVVKQELKYEYDDGSTLTPRKGVKVKKEPGETTKPLSRSTLSGVTRTRNNLASRKDGPIAWQKFYIRKNWAKRLVWRGVKEKTSTGLRKRDLMVNPRGRVVSKKVSSKSKRIYKDKHLDLWTQAAKELRGEKGLRGFVMMKKFGTSSQRRHYLEIRNRWLDGIAERVVGQVSGQPEMVERIRNLAQGEGN